MRHIMQQLPAVIASIDNHAGLPIKYLSAGLGGHLEVSVLDGEAMIDRRLHPVDSCAIGVHFASLPQITPLRPHRRSHARPVWDHLPELRPDGSEQR